MPQNDRNSRNRKRRRAYDQARDCLLYTSRPPQAPTMGGLCLMVGVLAAVGVGWTAGSLWACLLYTSPSPNVAENHQYYNAMELQKAGAAVVIEEKDLTGEKRCV